MARVIFDHSVFKGLVGIDTESEYFPFDNAYDYQSYPIILKFKRNFKGNCYGKTAAFDNIEDQDEKRDGAFSCLELWMDDKIDLEIIDNAVKIGSTTRFRILSEKTLSKIKPLLLPGTRDLNYLFIHPYASLKLDTYEKAAFRYHFKINLHESTLVERDIGPDIVIFKSPMIQRYVPYYLNPIHRVFKHKIFRAKNILLGPMAIRITMGLYDEKFYKFEEKKIEDKKRLSFSLIFNMQINLNDKQIRIIDTPASFG